jgi:hypothetical protein
LSVNSFSWSEVAEKAGLTLKPVAIKPQTR